MNLLKREDGAGKLKNIITLIIIVFVLYLGFKLIPVKVSAYQFDDFIEYLPRRLARENIHQWDKRPEVEITERLLKKARELELPVTERDLEVEVSSDKERVSVEVDYVVPVKFPFYTYKWHFSKRMEGTIG